MQPHSRSIFDLFDSKKRYVVPLFQRQYVWSREEQWLPLWEDIQRKVVEKLDGKEGPVHFLGAMVLDQKRAYGNQVPLHLVIDGQQRLTTFQIILAAFRDVCRKLGQTALAEECERYLLNSGIMAEPEIERFKVWPTQLDRVQFESVVLSGSREGVEKRHPVVRLKYKRSPEPHPPMVECYLFFYDQIEEFTRSQDYAQPAAERLEKFLQSLRGSLQVVTIEMEANDDPQVIFETLNGRGQPLLPSDLLRNHIFWRAAQNKEPQEELYEKHWLQFDDPFWREKERQGRLLRPRSDLFLQHYLALKRKTDVNIGHLFAEYKEWLKLPPRPFSTVRAELEELDRYRGFYRQLAVPESGTALGRLGRMLQIFDTTTAYPLILGILGRDLPGEISDGIFTDLESYVVRRAICGLTTKSYNRVFLALLAKLPEPVSREGFRQLLLDQQGESSLWPDDKRLGQEWLSRPAYEELNSARLSAIFQAIEQRLHHKKSERIEILTPLTVEHVMPQNWFEHWPLPNGNDGLTWKQRIDLGLENEDAISSQNRDRILQTFGNLTIITLELNISVSNNSYPKKRLELLKHTALTLNRYFQDVQEWNEERIQERGKVLFGIAKEIWPHAT
jgi:uncharacterized protein with ParB-like and HNH nuclease domain